MEPGDKNTPEPVDNSGLKETENLHNSILRTLENERDVIGDITSYQAQLAKLVEKSVGAQDMTTDLARAQRDIALERAQLIKNEAGLSDKMVKSKLASLAVSEQDLKALVGMNDTIQSVSKNLAPIADLGTDLADSIDTFVKGLPGGKALSKMFGIDDLSDRITAVVNTMGGAYIQALQAGKTPAQATAAAMKAAGTAMKAMLTPALLIAAAFAGLAMLFVGISKTAKETATNMGITFAQAKKLNDAARQAQSEFSTQLATMEDITAVQKEQIALLGSAALVNTKVAAGVADMGKAFGYGAEQAGKTHSALMLIGAEQEQASAIQLKTNKAALEAGVSVAAVQKDIADNAAGALKYMSGSAEAIADAAVKAAKLGVSLGTMVKVSDALLDIEGSLTAQFEFQALSGKEINLDLARQKALQGDIAGATEEALKAVKSTAEFDKMGVFAKEALAKATGVSVEELQKSLLIQEKLGDLTDDQKAAAANLGLSAAEMKNMSAEELQNRLAQQQSMDKAGAAFESMKNQLATALLPLAEAFGMVFTLLGPVLKTIGFLIKGILAPLTAMTKILQGNTGEMSTFQKIIGGVLIGLTSIKLVTMAIANYQKISNALATVRGTLTNKELIMTTARNALEKVGNALKTAGNFITSGLLVKKAASNALSVTGNTIDTTGNALKIAGNVQEGITTAAKGTQLGLQTGIAGASAATAASVTAGTVGQTAFAGATATAAGAQAGLAAAALTTNAATTFGVGTVIAIAAAALAIGALAGYMMKSSNDAKKVGDLSSPAKGKTQVSTAEGGLFETSPNDDVAAGPGILSRLQGGFQEGGIGGALGSLFGGGEKDSGGGMNNEAILTKLDQLISAAKTPPPVYIGNKAVTELASALQINDSFQTTRNVSGEDA